MPKKGDNFTPEQQQLIGYVKKNHGEIAACSVECFLAGESKRLIGITEYQAKDIRSHAKNKLDITV